MPVIQQEHGVKSVKGLPERWGRKAAAELAALAPAVGQEPCQQYRDLCAVLDKLTACPVPIDASYDRICAMASTWSNDCASVVVSEGVDYVPAPVDVAAPGDGVGPRACLPNRPGITARQRMEQVCRVRGIEAPLERLGDDEAMKRMIDAAWWRKRLLTLHARAFEHAALRLGYVSRSTGSYCSHETVARRQAQNARNEAMLKRAMMTNDQGQEFSLYDLAAKGMANKANRKGELMLRMAGCEDIAEEMGHVGLFVTLTCPSKYHAVFAGSGRFNPKYQNATPREAQDYLNRVWARVRAKNDRIGILPYGFRIAEPHHDGCPHWHMLVFLPRCQVEAFIDNLGQHARAEDAHELDSDAAKEARLKIIEIDPAEGGAAAYIAKYVGKNIDDSQGEAFDEDGAVDLLADADQARGAKACERVDAWASTWGIRQFQGLGMPPVTVWRELRRVRAAADMAPPYLVAALKACQRVESKFVDAETGKPGVIHAANFADYIRAQGGVNLGRLYRIGVAVEVQEGVQGKYGLVDRDKLLGVYARQLPHLPISASTRYTWERSEAKAIRERKTLRGSGWAPGVAVDFAGPWSPLNNCTPASTGAWFTGPKAPVWWQGEAPALADFTDEEWWNGVEFAENYIDMDEKYDEIMQHVAEAVNARLSAGWTFDERANTWSKQ